MKTIKIAHLYYDLMNLYGENGNVRALVKALEKQEVKVIVDFLSLEDEINFSKYDFFYIGAGTLENTLLVLEHLKKFQEDLINSFNEGKFFLITGDTIALFGNKFIVKNKEYEGLGIFNFTANNIDFRIVGEQIYDTNIIDKKIIGFQNRETVIDKYEETSLFTVNTGTGYKPNNYQEGIIKNNFWGTYLLGPILIRNPYLNEYLVKKIIESKKIKYKEIEKDIAYKAYDEFLKNFGEK